MTESFRMNADRKICIISKKLDLTQKFLYMAKITLEGKPINTNGSLPSVGKKAPDFKLIDQELKTHRLEDFTGKKVVLIVPERS